MFEPWMIPVLIVFIGCLTGVVIFVTDKVFEARRRAADHELRMLREKLSLRESRVQELERINRQLEQQVEWHLRLMAPRADGGPGSLPAPSDADPTARPER